MQSTERPVALITGAASGIGAACVDRFTRGGWATAGLDLRSAKCDMGFELDVRDEISVNLAVSETLARFGRIDALVTAAGYYEEAIPVTEISREQWDRMLSVILKGTVSTIAACLPAMLRRGQGAIVAISSELAIGGGSEDLHYVAAKGALLGLIKSLAVEVAATGVRVNAIAPGPTDTPLLAPGSSWREPAYLDTLPLRRLVTPEEVAATAWFLATEGGMYCGEVLSPNAGAVI